MAGGQEPCCPQPSSCTQPTGSVERQQAGHFARGPCESIHGDGSCAQLCVHLHVWPLGYPTGYVLGTPLTEEKLRLRDIRNVAGGSLFGALFPAALWGRGVGLYYLCPYLVSAPPPLPGAWGGWWWPSGRQGSQNTGLLADPGTGAAPGKGLGRVSGQMPPGRQVAEPGHAGDGLGVLGFPRTCPGHIPGSGCDSGRPLCFRLSLGRVGSSS